MSCSSTPVLLALSLICFMLEEAEKVLCVGVRGYGFLAMRSKPAPLSAYDWDPTQPPFPPMDLC
jgi:hypothetical protein